MTDPQTLPVPAPQKFCFACGRPIDARAEICPHCGVRQAPAPSAQVPGKGRAVTIFLALMFGGLGIHKFYLGKFAQGFLYLIFCWTYIPSIIAWVEALRYLTTSDEVWNATYGGPPHRASRAALGCLWLIALAPLLMFLLIIPLIFLGGQAIYR